MFIKNISRILEGFIYILLGLDIAIIIIIPFMFLPPSNLIELLEKITEISLFTIIILLLVPTILNKINKSNNNYLTKITYLLKNIHISLGILLIAIRVLHIEINLLFKSIELNLETITSILLSLLLTLTVIYAILRISNSGKYRRLHRLFIILTYLVFIIHLFH